MRIISVGIATLDIVNRVDRYPPEDAEVRATGQVISRGGNATNTLVVLSQLGHECAWAGVLGDDSSRRAVLDDLADACVDTDSVIFVPGGKTPTSCISVSAENGSRTIVHFRDLPEYQAEDFYRLPLDCWDWIHFEGRAVDETAAMIASVSRQSGSLRCSLEVEKPRPGIERLFHGPDVLMFSLPYALDGGFVDAGEFLNAMLLKTSAEYLFCAWGEGGGYALRKGGQPIHSPAYALDQVVDTLGAGDVFNAGVIDGLSRRLPVERVLESACRLAGAKCAQQGFSGLLSP